MTKKDVPCCRIEFVRREGVLCRLRNVCKMESIDTEMSKLFERFPKITAKYIEYASVQSYFTCQKMRDDFKEGEKQENELLQRIW